MSSNREYETREGRQEVIESNTSSPRAGSEPDERNEAQREQDAALAQSMFHATARSRSNTLANEGAKEREGASGTTSSRAAPASIPEGAPSSASRRRGSVGANVLDHLADDLEIQAHRDALQDRSFFDRSPSSPDNRPSAFSDRRDRFSMHTPSAMHNAAAARLYRHHRNLSDSSIDSQGGAFIDHRRQPHSLSIATGSRGFGGGGSGGDRGNMIRSPDEYGPRSAQAGRRQNSGEVDRYRSGGDLGPARSRSPPSPSAPRNNSDPSASAISSRTARAPYSDGSAIADDDDDNEPGLHPHIERHNSARTYRSERSGEADDHPDGFHLSRRTSLIGEPEEDVCFPTHGAAAEVDMLDLGMGAMYDNDSRHHDRHHHHHHQGVPGVLHNFPFPFDFSALEDYVSAEREGLPIPGVKRQMSGGIMGASGSPPGYGTSTGTRVRMGMSSSGEDGAAPRLSMRQRKLSESVGSKPRERYLRKLALFERTGDDPVTPQSFATILDTKSPLLASKPSGGYGSSAATGPNGSRPYRFSFYSNALPTTIHARSLADIPPEGQTFEDLFVGRNPQDDEADSGEPMMAFSPPSQTGTGTNTPSAPMGTSSNRNSVNGARPAGVPTHAHGGAYLEKPKSNMIRTDVDAEANTWWLDILCPTDQEMKVLSKVFGIHPLTTEDIQMEETREKIELFRNYYFVCFRSFEQDPYSPTYLEPLNMYIIVFREGTLSFHFRGTPHPQNVRRRIKQLKDYINVTSDWISYALIDDITDAFGPLIQNIEYEVDSIDELVLILKEAEQSDMLRRIGMCRKKVMGLLRLMGNKADVVKGLSKRCNENWSVAPKSDIGLYLSDIQDHITTSTQNLMHYEKILSRSHSNYLAQISIEMTDANNEINNVLSKLTALGTVLIPMNLITGLWGMNVHVPGQDVENLHWFFAIIASLGAIALGGAWLTYRVFVRSS